MSKLGFIHSIQSLGAADGPGVRFVVFLQGCNLRCGCCHNPDTWDMAAGQEALAEDIAAKAERYREYFGEQGGITISGGEPLLQAEFAREIFALCKARGINTCLDTSGSIWNEKVEALIPFCDRVLLDIKYTSNDAYREYAGCDLDSVLSFLKELEKRKIPTTLRQVIIPTLNDDEENILRLKAIANEHSCVDKVELLPFKKMCSVKYDSLGLDFRFGHLPEPSPTKIAELENILK
ncbi:MAG: pyruvate formate lyase-activating protein [Ruminococcaceae bacterium]|nr:pyruvate formate lyase-activating protein [Oscillospiraceae bacterium]